MRFLRTPHRTLRAAGLAAALALTGCVPATDASTVPESSAARRELGELAVVATAGSMSGYSRDRFPHWRRNGGGTCDVRDAVLRRDGEQVVLSNGCNVTGGQWYSVYDGKTLTSPQQVDIDHLVPLANAWRSGAAKWDDDQRADFANDLERPQLMAVSATSNRAKGDQDPALWRPTNRAYWCTYARDWIAVKHFWRLSVTAAEKAALTEMLGTCPRVAPQTSPPDPAG